jgi:hypothetical protein
LLNTVNNAFTPDVRMPEEEKSTYNGPYRFEPRQVLSPGPSPIETRDSSEKLYFAPQQPRLIDASGNPVGGFGPGPTSPAPRMGLSSEYAMDMLRRKGREEGSPFSRPIWGTFAKGGEVNMRDGSFVIDARTVSELGNGSSEAGQELLARMGGKPVKGPGDGVSDSIPAKIEGKQPARVARDEVVFSPEAVRRIGGGSEKKGAQKLYALMERAHKARKQAARGKDTQLRRGLA